MIAECYICYEALTQNLRALALNCGHVCCGPCLEQWLRLAEDNEEQCPVCRYLPPLEEEIALRPIFLRFRDGDASAEANGPAVATPSNNAEALVERGRALQTTLQAFVSAQTVSTQDFGKMMADMDKLKSDMQTQYLNRELKNIMADISTKLQALAKEFQARDQIEAAKRTLARQTTDLIQLRQRLEISEGQLRERSEGFATLSHKYAEVKDKWTKDRENLKAMLSQRERTEFDLQVEKKRLQDEVDQSRKIILNLETMEQKLKISILEHKRKLEKRSVETDELLTLRSEVVALRSKLKCAEEKNARQPLQPSVANLSVDMWDVGSPIVVDEPEEETYLSVKELSEDNPSRPAIALDKSMYAAGSSHPAPQTSQGTSGPGLPKAAERRNSTYDFTRGNLALGPKRSRKIK